MDDDFPSGWRANLATELEDLNSSFNRALDAAKAAEADEVDNVMPALAAAQGIAYLVQHLRQLPELADGKKTEYLQTIAMDLKNLADGMPTQFIKPYVLKHSPPFPHQTFYIRAQVVLTINVMTAAGLTRAPALRLIAKELDRIGLSPPRKSNKHGWATSTLARWHDEFHEPECALPWVDWARREMEKFRARASWPPSQNDAQFYLKGLEARISQKISIPPRPLR